jgi:protein SCO1/2
MSKSTWLLVLLAVVAAAGGIWVAQRTSDQAPQLTSGTWLPQPRPIPEVSLVDQSGQPFTNQNLQGHPTLLFFGFTHCPDVCPTTLARLAQVVKAANMPDLKVLLVSVDPERDTPELLERYVHAFSPDFGAVTGKLDDIQHFARELGIAIAKVDTGGGQYTVDHSAVVTLLNRKGQRVALFTPPYEVAPVAADLQNVANRL